MPMKSTGVLPQRWRHPPPRLSTGELSMCALHLSQLQFSLLQVQLQLQPRRSPAAGSSSTPAPTPARMGKETRWPVYTRATSSSTSTYVPWGYVTGHRLVGRGTLMVRLLYVRGRQLPLLSMQRCCTSPSRCASCSARSGTESSVQLYYT
jgi:hypothetical protein